MAFAHLGAMQQPRPRPASPEAAPPAAPDTFPLSTREFIAMMASMMALNALAIDAMLPALPDIGAALGVAAANDRQYVVSSYLLGVGVGSLFYGPLSDRFGRRPVILASLGFYIAFALVCAAAGDYQLLLAMRFAQGLSSGGLGVLVVSIIRDRFFGDGMARLMSLTFLIFLSVPVIAPTIGQLILYVASWRAIFFLFAAMATIVGLWVAMRLPETLRPDNVIPIRLSVIAETWRAVVFNRIGLFYILAAGTVMGALFGFLNSAQQIFAQVFGVPDIFPYAFACVAGAMAVTNYSNSRIVERFGARRVSHSALIMFIVLSTAQIGAALLPGEPMALFLVLVALNMSMVGFLGSNFGSIAMEPFGRMAGAASSFQSFVRTVLAAVLGAAIGQQFDGSTLPLAAGFLICGTISLALVMLGERGRLFTRPRTCPNTPL